MSYGRTFEELEPGQKFQHHSGRTITESDDTMFSLMSMNQHPVHIDEHYASRTQHGKRLVVGPLTVSIVLGLTQRDIGGASLEVLEYSDIQHLGPVFHGDTIYAESFIEDRQPLDDARGVVTVACRGVNQRGEPVLALKQKFVAPRNR
jgi:acyl dehydratase